MTALKPICENYINGNLRDFRNSIKELSKYDAFLLCNMLAYEFQQGYEKAIKIMMKYTED